MPVQWAPFTPMCAAWDDSLRGLLLPLRKQRIDVVSLVGRDAARPKFAQQWQRLGAVAGLPAGEPESGQHAQPVNQRVNLRAQAAARAAQRLFTFFWARQSGVLMRPRR